MINAPTIMKQALVLSLLVLSFASCKKSGNDTPPIDPNKQYTIIYDVADQTVKTSVVNDTINLDFQEKINFLVDPTEYTYSWAQFLEEDFTKSYLNNLHFALLSDENVMAVDFVSRNLNNVHPSQKSAVETTVNGKKYVKVQLARTFKFRNILASNQEAINKQNQLLQTTTDSVKFSSFYYYNGVFSAANLKTVRLFYTK
jgi:hypothetical protein